jgi:hypothetical protein
MYHQIYSIEDPVTAGNLETSTGFAMAKEPLSQLSRSKMGYSVGDSLHSHGKRINHRVQTQRVSYFLWLTSRSIQSFRSSKITFNITLTLGLHLIHLLHLYVFKVITAKWMMKTKVFVIQIRQALISQKTPKGDLSSLESRIISLALSLKCISFCKIDS